MGGTTDAGPFPSEQLLRALRWALVVTGALALVPVVATLLLRQVTIPTPWVVAYLSLTPFVAAAGVVAAVLFLLARSWAGLAVAGSATALLLLTQAPLYLGGAAPDGPTTPVTVMTVNLSYGFADTGQVADAMRDHDVDVLFVQELSPRAVSALRADGVEDELPYSVTAPAVGNGGAGIWSRHPLVEASSPSGLEHAQVAATVELGGQEVFLAAVHPVSPVPDDTAQWADELGVLQDWLGGVDGPAIIGGDFNATLDHRPFRDVLAAGYRDAGEQAGAGFLPTYPSNRRRIPLLITIDHVLTGGGIVATDLTRVQVDGTDHQGLVADLAVPGVDGSDR